MNFICDSSSLISLVETCNLDSLSFMKRKKKASFLVPPAVVYEIIENPLHIHRYAFAALRLKRALHEGMLEPFDAPGLAQKTREILQHANNIFSVNGTPLKILHPGEAECLAGYLDSQAKGIVVDEKTTRLLIESPQLLWDSLKTEFGNGVRISEASLNKLKDKLRGFSALRSTEIIAIAYENGYYSSFGEDETDAFHAAAYALRQAGCSITSHELADYEHWGHDNAVPKTDAPVVVPETLPEKTV